MRRVCAAMLGYASATASDALSRGGRGRSTREQLRLWALPLRCDNGTMVLRRLLALVVTLALLALPAAAAAKSSSKSGSSKSSGFGKSSSKGGFGSSKSNSKSGASKSSATKSRTHSSTKSASKGASKAGASGTSGSGLPTAPVHEDGSDAEDVRIRGSYFTEATFAVLPCEHVEIPVGERRCWRCGDAWYEKLVYDGQPVYVQVFAPEGARAEELPEHVQTIRGENGTYFAADDALYALSEDETGGFVVVSTEPGFEVDELPNSARAGIPIVADGFTYYRYLGVYYREEHRDGRTYYVASESPF